MSPFVTLVVETNIKVPPDAVPPLMVADPPRVKVVPLEVTVPDAVFSVKAPDPPEAIVNAPKSAILFVEKVWDPSIVPEAKVGVEVVAMF